MKKEFLTTGQISQYCEVNYRTVCKWINKGKLASFETPGGHNRVETSVFIDFCNRYNVPIPSNLKSVYREGKPNIESVKKRILIVDDDRGMVKSMKCAFVLENKYDIDCAFDGFSAGIHFNKFKPHLVILDIRMPIMDGFKVCSYIRSDSKNDYVKIIVISGFMDQEERMIRECGADDCLLKPFDNQVLLKKVELLLEERVDKKD